MTIERPSSGPLALLTEEEFSEFIWCLGAMTFNSIPAAALARHKRSLNTVKDYLDIMPGDSRPSALAKEYFKDLAGSKATEELAKKWFGKSASELAGEVSRSLAKGL
jgi:hypothetical protein